MCVCVSMVCVRVCVCTHIHSVDESYFLHILDREKMLVSDSVYLCTWDGIDDVSI
jgi:hypothetical protein